MILDERTEFADATALDTTGTDTDNFGDIIDLGVDGRDIGNGRNMSLVIQITTAVTSAGAATVAFQLVSDATSTISTSTQTIHVTSAAIGKATLVAGYEIVLPVPPGTYERYLGVQTVTGTAALTAGAANAFLALDYASNKSYADASN